jgi:DNA-binding MarR family transcriptional regulator
MTRAAETSDFINRVTSECVAVRVRLINRVITALYDEVYRPYGLRVSQGNILVAVAQMGRTRPVEISRILRIEKSTLSRDLDLMRKNGWLTSEPPAGGRNQTLRLTPEGRDLLRRVQPAWEQAQAEAERLIGIAGVNALHEVAARLGFGKPSE